MFRVSDVCFKIKKKYEDKQIKKKPNVKKSVYFSSKVRSSPYEIVIFLFSRWKNTYIKNSPHVLMAERHTETAVFNIKHSENPSDRQTDRQTTLFSQFGKVWFCLQLILRVFRLWFYFIFLTLSVTRLSVFVLSTTSDRRFFSKLQLLFLYFEVTEWRDFSPAERLKSISLI